MQIDIESVARPANDMDQKPALVFLCQRLPYPPIKGERITSFNLLRHLTRHYRVFVGTFIDDPADRAEVPKLRRMVERLHVDSIRKPWAYLRALPRWLSGEPISFALFRSQSLNRWLDDVESEHRPVAVVAHSSNVSAYAIDKFRRTEGAEPRRILHFSDVDSEKFFAYARRARGIKRWIFEEEGRRVLREERRLTAGADAVTFVTDQEADLFRSVVESHLDRVSTLPNGVDTQMFAPDRYPQSPFEGNGAALMFTGAMDYPPNVEAVTWFAREVLPGISRILPDVQFLVVGSNPTAEVRRIATGSTVIVTGRVESTAAYLAHAQVAVAPLQIARGIQNKVVEAMAMALPVVVSKGALTGVGAIPGEHLVCADSVPQWIDACVGLIQDRERARVLGLAARRFVLEHYNWEAQFKRLDRLLLRDAQRSV
jgi:sugar transferase (PEP-CTERM/EpsH1 system associated)